jgi:hypothetical protein
MSAPTIQPQWGNARAHARAARGELEQLLNGAGWPWRCRISRWIDCLLMIEESDPDGMAGPA